MRVAMFWALASCLPLVSGAAYAQLPDDCTPPPSPGPIEVTPASGAGGVTRDARVSLRYTQDFFAGFSGDPAALISVWATGTLEPVAGRVAVAGDVLFFLPDGLLAPSTSYAGRATGGIADFEFEFRTGTNLDVAAPVVGAIQSVSTQSLDPGCGVPDGGYRVDVAMERALEDGPDGSLEYLLYHTRGPGIDAPVLRTRRRGVITSDLFTMAFVLPNSEAVTPICVVVQVVDGVGKRDDSMEPRCFDPVEGNFFEPACSVSASGRARSGRAPVALLALVGLAWFWRGRHRRG